LGFVRPDEPFDLERVTLRWLGRRRLECGGKDMPAHQLAPRGPNNTFTVSQLFDYRARFAAIPRPTEADYKLGYDRPGRHAGSEERAFYQIGVTLSLVNAVAGLFA
jgi:hypothetical protein